MPSIPDNLEELRILHYPHPALREQAENVADPTDPQLARLADRMIQLMHEAGGVGLAAPQVGVAVRMFVADPTREPGREMVVVNPEVVQTEGWQETREGCLSIPEVTVKLRRRNRLVIRYLDLAGRTIQIDAVGHLASIFQHEGDHLDGRLIVDRAGIIGRLAIRDALKLLEEQFESAQSTA